MAAAGAGGAKDVTLTRLSQREQSLPRVPGHGSQAPAEQLPGARQPSSSSPFLQPQLKSPGVPSPLSSQEQRGPRPRVSGGIHSAQPVGIGSRAHTEPTGLVPTSVKTPLIGSRLPFWKTRACFSWTNSSGFLWKHASLSSSPAGQSLYELHKPPRGSEADDEAVGLLHSLAASVVISNLPRDDSLADRAFPHNPRGHLGQVASVHPVVRVRRGLIHALLRNRF